MNVHWLCSIDSTVFKFSDRRTLAKNGSAKFLWGNLLLGGKQQINAKNSNLEFFESNLYMKSVSVPLMSCFMRVSSCGLKTQYDTYSNEK